LAYAAAEGLPEVEYAALRESAAIAQRAALALAGGTSHDSWNFSPFPIAFVRGNGSHKWDADGRRYVDYWMGHGALILGHSHPAVMAAVRGQAELGFHFGGAHPGMVAWAERVVRMVPSAEKVRFAASGTEATMLAMRVARAYTGRQRIIRLDGHFHGWHDEAIAHAFPTAATGLNSGTVDFVDLVDPYDFHRIEMLLASGQIAAILLEPGGGSSGSLYADLKQLRTLRRFTRKFRTLLVFDEVITGFRYAPGGVQELTGVLPDLTVLGKILSGGLPGGAVAGANEVMACFGPTGRSGKSKAARARVMHSGTFNGNPMSAAAGIATLDLVRDGMPQQVADKAASDLIGLVNADAERFGLDVQLHGTSSIFHILIGARKQNISPGSKEAFALLRQSSAAHQTLRRHLLLEGVDLHPTHGWLSNRHDESTLDETREAFRRTFRKLQKLRIFH
jgi:glutamate-1-semialdehyde 2,1-aminomutase